MAGPLLLKMQSSGKAATPNAFPRCVYVARPDGNSSQTLDGLEQLDRLPLVLVANLFPIILPIDNQMNVAIVARELTSF